LLSSILLALFSVGAAAAPAAAAPAKRSVAVADVAGIRAAVEAPGARAVIVNVWATWCEPCREEMPELLRFWRDHRDRGVRLVLVSADDEDQRAEVERVLAAAGFDGPAFIKHGDDMTFIDSLDRSWSGALPSTFLYDGQGRKQRFWTGTIGYRDLQRGVRKLLPPEKSKTPDSKMSDSKMPDSKMSDRRKP
jgi:thiol-disulfide isomerase/thioredoxin